MEVTLFLDKLHQVVEVAAPKVVELVKLTELVLAVVLHILKLVQPEEHMVLLVVTVGKHKEYMELEVAAAHQLLVLMVQLLQLVMVVLD